MSGPINKPPATSPMLIRTMQMTFVAENVAIILNILLLTTFYYSCKQEEQRIYEANTVQQSPKDTKKKSSNSYRSSFGGRRNSTSQKDKHQLDWQTIYVTWALLIVGFIFSLCQGLLENWLTNDCGAQWLQWTTFFFYAAHRSLLLFSLLHRLYFVFKESAYAYPDWFYIVLLMLIVIHFIASYIIYVTDHAVTKVDIGMYTGYSGTILCSWSFGVLFSGIARPIEITLQIALVIPFLYKLWKLQKLSSNILNNVGERKRINKFLVIFRKVTLLAVSALISTVTITFGYVNYKPFAFALSLDAVFNSFCMFLMFQFNQKFIQPCFGNKCDRLCCVKCEEKCKYKIICGARCRLLLNFCGICCKDRDTEVPQKMDDQIKNIDSSANNTVSTISKSQIELDVMVMVNGDKSNNTEETNSLATTDK